MPAKRTRSPNGATAANAAQSVDPYLQGTDRTDIPSTKADAQTVQRLTMWRLPDPSGLKPVNLRTLLDEFEIGWLNRCARLWEQVRHRNYSVATVAGKRESALSGMRWDIVIKADLAEGRQAEADRHKQALVDFYSNLEATSLLDQDECGGVELLVAQMAGAIGAKYAVHEITWKPSSSPTQPFSARFTQWPLYSFESRIGRLRWCGEPAFGGGLNTFAGVDMPDNEWLVTVGPGLMRSTLFLVSVQTLGLQDWATYSEKFGLPFIIGKTDAGYQSTQWNQMKDMIAGFIGDGGAVVNASAEIELLTAGGPGTMPQPGLVEFCDRWISALWRGADLSTMSAGQGQGQGASIQQHETEKLSADDARLISGTLKRISQQVIEYLFGEGTMPLADFVLIPPVTLDTAKELAIDEFAVAHGVELGVDDFRERFNRAEPPEGAELLEKPLPALPAPGAANDPSTDPVTDPAEAVNEAAQVGDHIAHAVADDFQALRHELEIIMAIDDPGEMRRALMRWQATLPERSKRLLANPRAAARFEELIAQSVASGVEAKTSAAAGA